MPEQRKQCFIVGPMKTREDREKMKSLARDILEPAFRLQKDVQFDVVTPLTLQGGDIANNVIREIDRAEIMVVNLTGNNPNVFYELALCHALGVPCIIIQEEDSTPSFYAARNLCLTIDFNDPSDSIVTLADHIGNILRGENPETYLESPVTNFFTRAIIDISPATGVAQGYYFNFIRHIREALGRISPDGKWQHKFTLILGKDAEGKEITQELTHVQRRNMKYRIIIPSQLKFTTQQMVNRVNNSDECIRGRMTLYHYDEKTDKLAETRSYGVTFHKLSGDQYEMVEIPTSMNPMIESLDLRMRVKNAASSANKPLKSLLDQQRQHFEKEEIHRFQSELENLIRKYEEFEDKNEPGRETFNDRIEIIYFDTNEDADELRKKNSLWLRRALEGTQ